MVTSRGRIYSAISDSFEEFRVSFPQNSWHAEYPQGSFLIRVVNISPSAIQDTPDVIRFGSQLTFRMMLLKHKKLEAALGIERRTRCYC